MQDTVATTTMRYPGHFMSQACRVPFCVMIQLVDRNLPRERVGDGLSL